MEVLFREEQRFTQWWLWVIILLLAAIPVYGMYEQLLMKRPFGDHPLSDVGLIIFAAGIFIVVGLFRLMRLRTEITSREIRIYFFPFFRKVIAWSDVQDAVIVNYGFVGYGIRYGSPYGVVYNVKGRYGLSIRMKSGAGIVVGTQLKELLAQVTEQCLQVHS